MDSGDVKVSYELEMEDKREMDGGGVGERSSPPVRGLEGKNIYSGGCRGAAAPRSPLGGKR